MVSSEIPNKVLDRIKKLKAMADQSVSVNEATNAAAMMAEILLKYNLNLEDVDFATERNTEFVKEARNTNGDGAFFEDPWWRVQLLDIVAKNNFCKVLKSYGQHNFTKGYVLSEHEYSYIVGEKHNIEIVDYIYSYLRKVLERVALKVWSQYTKDKSNPRVKEDKWRESFFAGANMVLNQRLAEMKRHVSQTNENTMALVIVKDKDLEDAFYSFFPHLRPKVSLVKWKPSPTYKYKAPRGRRSTKSYYNDAAFSAGATMAAEIPIHQGVKSGTEKTGGFKKLV